MLLKLQRLIILLMGLSTPQCRCAACSVRVPCHLIGYLMTQSLSEIQCSSLRETCFWFHNWVLEINVTTNFFRAAGEKTLTNSACMPSFIFVSSIWPYLRKPILDIFKFFPVACSFQYWQQPFQADCLLLWTLVIKTLKLIKSVLFKS